MSQPALRLVDAETGEVHSDCPRCLELADQLAGAEAEGRSWRAKYAKLKRDRDAAARDHELWPVAVKLFEEWREVCRHPGCEWGTDRFELVMPLLKRYGLDVCRRAIAGAQFDPYTYRRKNGTSKRCDEWERIFKNSGMVEDFANRAPVGWTP